MCSLSSNAADSTEIYQEGLRIPPSRLASRGVPNETLWDLIAQNVRQPHRVIGDIRAILSALPLVPAAPLREAFYAKVTGLLADKNFAAVAPAALEALGYVPGHEADAFKTLEEASRKPE